MAVLLLHSSLSSGRQWQVLKRQWPDFEGLSPDLFGYGTEPVMLQRPFRLEQEAAPFVSWLLEQPALSVILVGHSYGGAVALHLARCYPKQIKALLLFEPVAFHLLAQQQDAESQLLLQEVLQLSAQIPASDPMQAAELFVDYWQSPGYFAALPLSMRQKMAAQVWKVAADFEALIAEPATLQQYQRAISCPVLLMSGKYSRRSALEITELLHAALPQSVWIQTETGHMGPVSQPELINSELLRFLADQALLT